MKNRKCKWCNKDLLPRNKKYCSNNCQGKLKRFRTFEKYDKSEIFDGGPRTIKAYLLSIDGNMCVICENQFWMGKPIPLILDHIDGNYKNNAKDNLRLVCGNCDMQLPTYKSKNRGNGRHSRRKRYKEGKSY